MLNNYGAHCLDQLLQITGYDVNRLFSNVRLVASLGDAEDVVKVIYETKNGILGEMDINQASPISPHFIQIWGTQGAIESDDREINIRYFLEKDLAPKKLNTNLASTNREYPQDSIDFREEVIPVDNEKYQIDFYKDFAHSIRAGKPPLVKPKETLALMELIESCRKNGKKIFREQA
jgi:predicted dehydrogenase